MLVVAGRAQRKFSHVEAAEFEAARRIEAREHGRRMIGDEIGADFRAAGADLAGAVEHVLVRKRYAMQRPDRTPGFDGPSAARACSRAASAVTRMKQLSTG